MRFGRNHILALTVALGALFAGDAAMARGGIYFGAGVAPAYYPYPAYYPAYPYYAPPPPPAYAYAPPPPVAYPVYPAPVAPVVGSVGIRIR